MRALLMSLVVLGLAGSAACHRSSGVNSKAAVQQAIEEHVKQRPNLASSNMTVEIGDVAFNGDTAQAQVKFRSKQAPSLAVGMLYKLRRAGNGWQVESTSTTSMPGTTPHGNTAAPTPSPTTNPTDIGPQPSH
jgi:uncharacterized protein YhdP